MNYKDNIEQLILKWHDDFGDGVGEHEEWCKANIVTMVESDWEIDYKDYAYKSTIYAVQFDELEFYQVTDYRSGSYYSDYEYGESGISRVYPHKVTTTVYKGTPQ